MLVLTFCSVFFWKLIFFNRANSRAFVFFSTATIFLLSALRSPEEGVDVKNYINLFYRFSDLSYGDIFLLAKADEISDPIFWVFTSFLAKAGLSHWFWVSSIALLFAFSVYIFVRKNANFPLLALVLIIALGYLTFSYSGLRQTVALSIVMVSLNSLFDGKRYRFFVGVLFASLFHLSAIVSLSFLLFNIRLRLFYYVIGIILSLFIGIFLESQVRSLIALVAGQQYSDYAERSVSLKFTGVFIYLSILIFCLSRFKEVSSRWSHAPILYNSLLVGFGFQCLSLIVAEMFRVAMYFNIVSVVLIGYALMSYERLFRSLSYLSILSASLALFIVPRV